MRSRVQLSSFDVESKHQQRQKIPLAYLLSISLELGPKGVFIAIVSAESMIAIAAMVLFRRGKLKQVKI